LSSQLPRVRVPLSGPDPDVILNLQHIFQQVYEAGAFERSVNYAQPLTMPLSEADRQWVTELLQE
jgi:hypothetical protein